MVALVSGLPLAVSSLVGLFISILQSATQIQEQSVSYCAKFLAVGSVVALCAPWFSTKLIEFYQTMIGSIVALGNMP